MKIVIGLGLTGLSCIDYLVAKGETVIAMDTRENPAGYQTLKKKHPQLPCFLGGFDRDYLQRAEEIILSPGVPPKQPSLIDCANCGIPIISDIELLIRATTKPIYAITGSNGKTTVTSLLGEMAKAADNQFVIAGNIGTPVLEAISDTAQGYILELSSFQLDITHSLAAKSAVVLNVSPDHLDRYENFAAYRQSKQRIYQHCEYPIINLDQPDIWQDLSLSDQAISVSLSQPADYGLQLINKVYYLTIRGEPVLSTREMRLTGRHNWQNALVALAMGQVMQLPLDTLLSVLKNFCGLPHRCQWVRTLEGVSWYNDSKGTNIGATETAINSMAENAGGDIILLAGGLGKGADFSELRPCIQRHVKSVMLFGEDAGLLADAWQSVTEVNRVDSLSAAVDLARQRAKAGDIVLLSPACASFDMFKSFEDRGEQFMKQVNAL